MSRSVLLGIDHATYGEYSISSQHDGRTACALSVGSSAMTPAHAYKGDVAVPNEDAVLAADQGERSLLAVADGHYGHRASHVLMQRLDATLDQIPRNIIELFDVVLELAESQASPSDTSAGEAGEHSEEATTQRWPQASQPGAEARWPSRDPSASRDAGAEELEDESVSQPDASESSFLIAVLDRERQRVFGLCYGDSSLVIAGDPSQSAAARHSRRQAYVTPFVRDSLIPHHAVEFDVPAPPNCLVIAFTDGVDECVYRNPSRSIQPADITQLAAEAKHEAEPLVTALIRLALNGVRGAPGGQDNVAIAATRS